MEILAFTIKMVPFSSLKVPATNGEKLQLMREKLDRFDSLESRLVQLDLNSQPFRYELKFIKHFLVRFLNDNFQRFKG